MMRADNTLPIVYVCTEPIDFRKQINGLAVLVQEVLALNPFREQLFAFRNRRRDRCKILYWEHSGFVLWMKRLDRNGFSGRGRSPDNGGRHPERPAAQLAARGYDLSRLRPHRALSYAAVI